MPTSLTLVTGKGGVGKSAVAAALALSARRHGQRVLAIDMTNGGGLGAHLGEPDLTFEPRPIGIGLEASVIDRADALIEYLRVQIGLPALATMGPAARAFDALASTAPAVREVVTIGKVLWEVRREVWDLVVADAPPTGQIGSYLRAARTVRELVSTGRILDQVEWMEDILTDPERTHLSIVTLLEELPAVESAETLAWVRAEDVIGSISVIANRVLPPLGAKVPDGTGPVAETAALHHDLWQDQQEWADYLEVDRSLPYLFGTYTPPEVGERLSDALEEET
ncbi:MAG TPA: ArsA-related P-loop ATPase [Acidimicrobiia bacterium]|nr:ArsA-related P-loop ATPase [Acidimicrobiia bacterium]